MTTSLPSAARAAADEIDNWLYERHEMSITKASRDDIAAIVAQHVEPIVRAVEGEREELRNRLDQLISSVNNQHTDARHHDNEWGPAVTLAMDTRMERDQALAKLAACEADLEKLRLHAAAFPDKPDWIGEHLQKWIQGKDARVVQSKKIAHQAIDEKVAALTRADSAEALLREARSGVEAIAQHHEARSRGDDRAEQQAEKWRYLIHDIDKHFAKRGTP